MSVHCIDVLWRSGKHEGTTLLVLLALADWADEAGFAYPAVDVLAAKCRVGRASAFRALAELRRAGDIVGQGGVETDGRGAVRRSSDNEVRSPGRGLRRRRGINLAALRKAAALTPIRSDQHSV